MRLITFTEQQLRAMPRPQEYMDELRACAVTICGDRWTFDRDNPKYIAIKAKYRTSDPRESLAVGANFPCRGCGDS